MSSTRALVFKLTPGRLCKTRSTVPIEIPSARAISLIPPVLGVLFIGFEAEARSTRVMVRRFRARRTVLFSHVHAEVIKLATCVAQRGVREADPTGILAWWFGSCRSCIQSAGCARSHHLPNGREPDVDCRGGEHSVRP